MAVVLRKQPQSVSPPAASRIEIAQAALEETNRRLAELNEKRGVALLKDDDLTAIRLGGEIDALQQAVKTHEDKIRLLKGAAEKEATERRVREREDVIKRIEKKLSERDAAGKELADAVAAADQAYRKLIDIGATAQSEWSWPPSDVQACLFSAPAITHALTAELYRVGGRPRVGGGQVEPHGIHAGVNFPGARVSRFEWTNLPERIPTLTDVLKQATEHASGIMRGKRPSAQVDGAVSAPVPAASVNTALLTTTQQRLSELLLLQAKAAEDVTPAGEAEYARVVSEIAKVQSEITATKQMEQQHHA
jgi:hypothetical protein